MLVDDSVRYAHDCKDADIPVILFGNYAWNAGKHESLNRAHNWSQAVQQIFQQFPDVCLVSAPDHELTIKRRGVASKITRQITETLQASEGVRCSATGDAIPVLLQVLNQLETQGTVQVLDIKTYARPSRSKPKNIVGELFVHVHRSQQMIESVRTHRFTL